jgi:hypothetical protein
MATRNRSLLDMINRVPTRTQDFRGKTMPPSQVPPQQPPPSGAEYGEQQAGPGQWSTPTTENYWTPPGLWGAMSGEQYEPGSQGTGDFYTGIEGIACEPQWWEHPWTGEHICIACCDGVGGNQP